MTSMPSAQRVTGTDRIITILANMQANNGKVICSYCPNECTPANLNLQIDHIIPRHVQLLHVPENWTVSCRSCNERKGKMGVYNTQLLLNVDMGTVIENAYERAQDTDNLHQPASYITRTGTNVQERMELARIYIEHGFDWIEGYDTHARA